MKVKLVATGSMLGSVTATSNEIELGCGLESGTIEKLIGIRNRCLASSDQTALDLAFGALKNLIETNGDAVSLIKEKRVLVICANSTSEYSFPALASFLQKELGIVNGFSFDVNAACNGFQVALTTAASYIHSGLCECAYIVGVSVISKWIDWQKPDASLYFADGAGAALLTQDSSSGNGFSFASKIMTQPREVGSVTLKRGTIDAFVNINGMEVWKQVVTHFPKVIRSCLEEAGLNIEDVDHFVFHQANKNLIMFLCQRLGIPAEKAFINIENIGNTSEASMIIALDELNKSSRLKHGHKVLIGGVGAGFTFGATVFQW